ncbi:hypothetical protein MATL_G00254940 [Megalops atlanticus]|uniref:ABC transmembrane type-1 domain-containing protein n=1 Tax=Megalops atlanticus TaxID=7932 RepID=A0A9D3SZX5_MEGAT|nr:hypothetical protein MATL_G00254940 [Megalops atlanticus]
MFYLILTSKLKGTTAPLRSVYSRLSKVGDLKSQRRPGSCWTQVSNIHSSTSQRNNAIVRLWGQAQRALRQSTVRASRSPRVTLGFVVGPAALTVSARLFCSVAHCQVDFNNNDPVQPEEKAKETQPEFNWAILWEFIKPQLLALLGAIVLAFGAAALNIQIPLMLGDLVNVVARYMREHPGNYLREIRGPAFKLLGLYGLQGLRSVTQTLGCFVSLYLISPKLTGLTVVVMPCLVGAGALIGSFLRRLSRKAQEQVAKATGVADEALGNVRTVKAFAMEDWEMQ